MLRRGRFAPSAAQRAGRQAQPKKAEDTDVVSSPVLRDAFSAAL